MLHAGKARSARGAMHEDKRFKEATHEKDDQKSHGNLPHNNG